MKKTTPTLHDAVFKQFLTHPDTARDFLELHLPPALLQFCDLNTLKLESGSFIESGLRAYYSDVLYSLHTEQGTVMCTFCLSIKAHPISTWHFDSYAMPLPRCIAIWKRVMTSFRW